MCIFIHADIYFFAIRFAHLHTPALGHRYLCASEQFVNLYHMQICPLLKACSYLLADQEIVVGTNAWIQG